ncbi:hypothetical protein FOA52_015972 [Chlamydomonas sp. UWO 241]|nr:hypothetical protein FOA52_015972 [Chlamydomonas sp. UWO 241]
MADSPTTRRARAHLAGCRTKESVRRDQPRTMPPLPRRELVASTPCLPPLIRQAACHHHRPCEASSSSSYRVIPACAREARGPSRTRCLLSPAGK